MQNIWNSGFQNNGLLVTKDSNAEKGNKWSLLPVAQLTGLSFLMVAQAGRQSTQASWVEETGWESRQTTGWSSQDREVHRERNRRATEGLPREFSRSLTSTYVLRNAARNLSKTRERDCWEIRGQWPVLRVRKIPVPASYMEKPQFSRHCVGCSEESHLRNGKSLAQV